MDAHQPETFALKDVYSRGHRESLAVAAALLAAAYVVEHIANAYAFAFAARATSNHVGDLFLESLPVIDLNFLIIEGALISIVVVALFVLSHPRYILFTLKAVAFFIIIRALFISFTHVGIYPEHIDPGFGFFDNIYLYLNFQLGLFFSGHTGLPFLMALIFWRKLYVRAAFLALSFVFGVAVLLAHVHYSIDVFAAPFMAYSIFKLVQHLFPRDYALIESAP